ncbi:MAG: arginase family protein, partial [Mycobacterium sp.]
GAVRGDRFLQIGLRGYWPEPPELLWMAERGMRGYELAEIQRRGLDEVITEALAIAVDDTDGVFLSVDIDVVDPGLAPGTGTPEPGGLTGRELLDAARRIGREVNLVGLEIVEVAPPYDQADVTAMLANRVVLETLSGIARRRADAASGTRWDESTPLLAGRVPASDPVGSGAASDEITSYANAVATAQATAELVAADRDHERAL